MLRRSTISLIAGLFLILPCGSAFGAIIPRATLIANPPTTPFGAPDAALPAPWQSYQLSLEATAGELIGAVDVTINGSLHQRWFGVDMDGSIDPTPNGPAGGAANMRGDSHLTAPAGSPFGAGPSETNSKEGSPLVSDPGNKEYGLGGVRGAWAILSPQAVTNLAYIVVRKDQIRELELSVLCGGSGCTDFGWRTADFFPPVPEPATITMLAVAMLGSACFRVRAR